jgi:hypothetical protein
MVNWLDEELRRERAEVTKLQQLVERQTGELTEQARKIRDLEGHLANTRAQVVQFTQIEENLQHLKNEVVLMLDKQEQQRRQELRDAERLRLTERETLSTAISEVRKELQILPRYDEGLRLREAEDRRLSEVVMTLRHEVTAMGKDFDERARNLSYLAEQRSYDNKRISGLQEENLTLLKRTEQQENRLKSLADTSQRHERHVQELLQFKTDLTRQQVDWMESQRLDEQARKRQMEEWREEVDAQRAEAQDITKRMKEFNEAAALGRQAMGTLETFKEQLRRDQNQVAELQRLAEERQRKELEEWQGEDEKRWKKHEMQWEHQWKEQYERHNALTARLAAVEDELKALEKEMATLWRLNELYSAHRLGEVQRWQGELESVVAERDKLSRRRR